jgi:hypothetical protein
MRRVTSEVDNGL